MLLAKEDKKKSSNSRTRIRKAIAEYPTMKFSFEEMPKAFLVSLSYDKQLQNTKTAVNDPENVTERASLLVIEIKNNPFITTSELAEKLNITRMTVHRDLEKLKNSGAIVRIGPDKGGHWEVKK